MLKKLAARLNPFANTKDVVPSGKPTRSTVAPYETHPHSFACACAPCVAHTSMLTEARLKRQ